MTRHARVMLHAKVRAGSEQEFEENFKEVTRRMQAAEGHIQDELIRLPDQDEPTYIVLSEWLSKEAFLTWFHNPRHHDTTAPISPFWYGHDLKIWELVERLPRYEPKEPGPDK